MRVEDIDDPQMQKIRYLSKLVDELAKGKTMDTVLCGPEARRRYARRYLRCAYCTSRTGLYLRHRG